MNMIDKVAHALTGHINGVCCNKTGGLTNDPKCECRALAIAAIEAMREPTPDMVAMTIMGLPPICDKDTGQVAYQAMSIIDPDSKLLEELHQNDLDAAHVLIADWHSMIDAALKGDDDENNQP